MSIEFAEGTSIKPLVFPDVKADVARKTFIGSIRRVKRKFKVVLWMRIVDDREWLVSTKRVDIKVTARALVTKPCPVDATTITVEASTVVDRSNEKVKRMRRMRRMCYYLLHLATRLMEREVAWPA